MIMVNSLILQDEIKSEIDRAGYDPAVDGKLRGENGSLAKLIIYGMSKTPVSARIFNQTVSLSVGLSYSSQTEVLL